jgi:hypothetical protein
MTDEQWIRAMRRYSTDDRPDFLKGGAHELSSVLEHDTASDPVRFARLGVALPADINPCYFDAILRGVAASESAVPVDLTKQLLERCHALPGRPSGRWIARPLLRHADEPIPSDLLELVAWYAEHDPDPPRDRDEASEDNLAEDLLQHGLNTVRGGIAHEIARLVYTRADHLPPLQSAIGSLVADAVTAVRAMAAEVALALLRHHRNLARDVFKRLTDGANENLLATHHVHEYLRYRATADFEVLRPLIERMVNSDLPGVREEGAVQATLVALSEGAAHELADRCLNGTDEQREGAARVYAANLTTARFRARCEAALERLFNDESADVRNAAAAAFRRLDEADLGTFEGLARRFVQSDAFPDNADDILYPLTETIARVPDLALDACERVLGEFGSEISDIRTAAASHANSVSQILVRAYADGADQATKDRALDLIDRSLELNMYGAYRALEEHDRTWTAM